MSGHGCVRKCQKSVPSGHRAGGTGGEGQTKGQPGQRCRQKLDSRQPWKQRSGYQALSPGQREPLTGFKQENDRNPRPGSWTGLVTAQRLDVRGVKTTNCILDWMKYDPPSPLVLKTPTAQELHHLHFI